MDKKQKLQERDYSIPYHYISSFHNGFSYTLSDSWGAAYCASIEFLVRELKKVEFSSLIDIGCGDGRLLREIDNVFEKKRLFGIDFSRKAIGFAKVINPSLNFSTKSIQSIEKRFDIVTLIEVIEHIPPKQLHCFINSITSVLNKNGHILLTVPNLNRPADPRHFQHFSVESLKALFDQEIFKIVAINFIEPIPKSLFGKFLHRFLFNSQFAIKNKQLLESFYNNYKRSFVCNQMEDSYRIYMKLQLKETKSRPTQKK